MFRITSKEVLSWNPCDGWTLDKIEKTLGKSKDIIAMDFIVSDDLSASDKLWAILRPELLTDLEIIEIRKRFIEYAEKNATERQAKRNKKMIERSDDLTHLCASFSNGENLSVWVDIVKGVISGNNRV